MSTGGGMGSPGGCDDDVAEGCKKCEPHLVAQLH